MPRTGRSSGAAGVFSIRPSEQHGGLGLGMAESVVVFEELGRALVPGPLVASALAAGLVDGASDGTVVVGSVTRPPPGAPALVAHLDALGVLVVVDDEGLALVDPSVSRRETGRAFARPADPHVDRGRRSAGRRTARRTRGCGRLALRRGAAVLRICVGIGSGVSRDGRGLRQGEGAVRTGRSAPSRRSSTSVRTCSCASSSLASRCMRPR